MKASIITLFLLMGCGQSTDGTANIGEIINAYLGVTPYLPETEYDIGNIQIQYSPKVEDGDIMKGDPFTASIEYKVSLDEKVDEAFKKEWEEKDPLIDIVYGDLYWDDTAILVTVGAGGIGELEDAERIKIDGHEVQYQYIQREGGTAVFIFMNVEDIGYQIQYQAEKEDIEEEAKAFAKDIINHQ